MRYQQASISISTSVSRSLASNARIWRRGLTEVALNGAGMKIIHSVSSRILTRPMVQGWHGRQCFTWQLSSKVLSFEVRFPHAISVLTSKLLATRLSFSSVNSPPGSAFGMRIFHLALSISPWRNLGRRPWRHQKRSESGQHCKSTAIGPGMRPSRHSERNKCENWTGNVAACSKVDSVSASSQFGLGSVEAEWCCSC